VDKQQEESSRVEFETWYGQNMGVGTNDVIRTDPPLGIATWRPVSTWRIGHGKRAGKPSKLRMLKVIQMTKDDLKNIEIQAKAKIFHDTYVGLTDAIKNNPKFHFHNGWVSIYLEFDLADEVLKSGSFLFKGLSLPHTTYWHRLGNITMQLSHYNHGLLNIKV
jgi:hypothetical protein